MQSLENYSKLNFFSFNYFLLLTRAQKCFLIMKMIVFMPLCQFLHCYWIFPLKIFTRKLNPEKKDLIANWKISRQRFGKFHSIPYSKFNYPNVVTLFGAVLSTRAQNLPRKAFSDQLAAVK